MCFSHPWQVKHLFKDSVASVSNLGLRSKFSNVVSAFPGEFFCLQKKQANYHVFFVCELYSWGVY